MNTPEQRETLIIPGRTETSPSQAGLEGLTCLGQHGAVDERRRTILILEDNEHRVELMSEALDVYPGRFVVECWENVWAMQAHTPGLAQRSGEVHRA